MNEQSNDTAAWVELAANVAPPVALPGDDDIVLEVIDAPAASSDWTEDELDAAIAALAPLLF
jgi:hypothetical protein